MRQHYRRVENVDDESHGYSPYREGLWFFNRVEEKNSAANACGRFDRITYAMTAAPPVEVQNMINKTSWPAVQWSLPSTDACG